MAKAAAGEKVAFTDAGLTALLEGKAGVSLSYREPGIAGALLAILDDPRFPRAVKFYFRNQAGKEQRLIIGVWQTAARRKRKGGISLLTAIETYREWGLLAVDHSDLKAYFAEQKEARKREAAEAARLAELEARKGTVQHLLDAYLESRAQTASHKEIMSVFRSVPEDIRSMYAKDVRPEHITRVIAAYLEAPARKGGRGASSNTNASNGKLTTGDKLRRYLHAAFEFGGKADYDPLHQVRSGKVFGITSNPVAMIQRIDPGNAKPRALTDGEMGALLAEIEGLPELHRAIALAHVYFGGQRIRQLFRVTWADFDGDSVMLIDRKGRGKTEKTSRHAIPLTPRLKEILAPLNRINAGAPGPFSLNGKTLVNENTVTDLFIELSERIVARGLAERFTGKAIRSTCETFLTSRQIGREYRAWLLSHQRTGVQEINYNVYNYWKEKTEALILWHGYLDGLAGRHPV